jgi:hypothetical protein
LIRESAFDTDQGAPSRLDFVHIHAPIIFHAAK